MLVRSFRDGELDPAEPAFERRRFWPDCGCRQVAKGGCRCEDDGYVTHGGVYREGQDLGHFLDGRYMRTSQRGKLT